MTATTSPDTDAARIQAAVLGCAAVAGVAVTPASFLPGQDVAGVELRDDTVEVHVIAAWGQPLVDVGNQIGAAVGDLLSGRNLHVHVDDILLPGQKPPPTPAELAAAARERVADIGRSTADAARTGATAVRDAARDAADTVADRTQDAQHAASDVADDAEDAVSDVADDAKRAVSDVAEDARHAASDVDAASRSSSDREPR